MPGPNLNPGLQLCSLASFQTKFAVHGHIVNLTKSLKPQHSTHAAELVLHQKSSNLKDHFPSENKSGIYQINSKDCEKIYIGKTKRGLETRVKEYFRNI